MQSTSYPDQLEIQPLRQRPLATVRVPGSKSITNRALVLAALAEPTESGARSILEGALHSEDTEVMVDCLRKMGVDVQADWPAERLTVPAVPRAAWARQADLYVGNSGTTMRFLTAVAALGPGTYRLDGNARMRERPIEDLLTALRQLGVPAESEAGNGCPPVRIQGGLFRGGKVRLKGDVSSQFLSGLLLAAPLAPEDVTIVIEGGLVSVPYVDMTMSMQSECGIRLTCPPQSAHSASGTEPIQFHIQGGQRYPVRRFQIEPDASAASYFFAAALIGQGEVTVQGAWQPHLQGDLAFLDLLEQMGGRFERQKTGITVTGTGALHGIEADMNAISDTVMTLAAVACFAQGPTTIRNVAHVRHKESDRLHALAVELGKTGAQIEEFADGLTIHPHALHGARLETYNDHRLAMSLSLLGLRVPGIIIENPACVAKTYPRFFADLELLRLPASP